MPGRAQRKSSGSLNPAAETDALKLTDLQAKLVDGGRLNV